MAFLLTTALKDLKRRLADPFALVIWAGIPLLIGGLVGLMSGGTSDLKAHVFVADQDDTLLSSLVAGSDWGGLLETVRRQQEIAKVDQGRKVIGIAVERLAIDVARRRIAGRV